MVGHPGANWRGRAFGLSIESVFPLPGLAPGAPVDRDRPLRVDLAPSTHRADELPDGVDVSVERGDMCYRFRAREAGVFELRDDGSQLLCTPEPAAGWLWRRFLICQAIPFAAVLQGLEVFHASAVEVDGAAVALVGPSGVGKSTLALNMHLAGAGFLTDDALAVELVDGVVLAHPGIPTVKVRAGAVALLHHDRRRLGAVVSSDTEATRYEISTVEEPLPVETFCLLQRQPATSWPVVEETEASPRTLLASTFNLVVSDPARVTRQLDVCAALAGQARVASVGVPARPGPSTAATLRRRLEPALVA